MTAALASRAAHSAGHRVSFASCQEQLGRVLLKAAKQHVSDGNDLWDLYGHFCAIENCDVELTGIDALYDGALLCVGAD